MNHVNFNDDLDIPRDLLGGTEDGVDLVMPDEVLKSPIFMWDDKERNLLLSLSDQKDILSLIQSEKNVMPFNVLRLYIAPNEESRSYGANGCKLWVAHLDGRLRIRMSLQYKKPSKNSVWSIDTNSKLCSFGLAIRILNKMVVLDDLPPNERDGMVAMAQITLTSLCWFIRESRMASNFIASVIPDKKGKSVEWTRARTHYVIINKTHPANNKDIKIGDTITPDEKYAKRMAHSRRAHTRILRSPFFKNLVGQTIRVKACWCGPSEWKQFGSIYRMEKKAA